MSPNTQNRPAMKTAPITPTTVLAPPTGIDTGTKDDRKDMPRTDLPAIAPQLAAPNTGSGGKNDDGAPAVTPNPTAPLTVPAAPTAESLWAATIAPKLQEILDEHFKTLPAVSAWVEPTEDEINARIDAILVERNIPARNFKAIGDVAEEVEKAVKAERAAAGGDNAAKLRKAHANALLDLINKDILAHVRTLGGMKERATTAKMTGGEKKPKAAAATIKVDKAEHKASRAAPYIAWAKANGMEHFIRIDNLAGMTPIKGVWHARILLEDGNYEEIDFNEKDGSYMLTGRITDGVLKDAASGEAFDTGSAPQRMGVFVKNDAIAALSDKGWAIMPFPTVKADALARFGK